MVIAAALAAPLAAAPATTAASQGATCTYDATTRTISIDLAGDLWIYVESDGDTLIINHGRYCPGATISGTRTVSIYAGDGSVGIIVLDFYQQHGGALEHTPSGLRFVLDNRWTHAGYPQVFAHAWGTPGPDVMTATTTDGIDLDGDGVLDVVPAVPGQLISATLSGLEGNDTLHSDYSAVGGIGNDTLFGPILSGGPGNDTLNGLATSSGTRASLNAGKGDDVIYAPRKVGAYITAGGGNDFIHARQGQSDDIDGGKGIDRAEIDRTGDSTRNVERLG